MFTSRLQIPLFEAAQVCIECLLISLGLKEGYMLTQVLPADKGCRREVPCRHMAQGTTLRRNRALEAFSKLLGDYTLVDSEAFGGSHVAGVFHSAGVAVAEGTVVGSAATYIVHAEQWELLGLTKLAAREAGAIRLWHDPDGTVNSGRLNAAVANLKN